MSCMRKKHTELFWHCVAMNCKLRQHDVFIWTCSTYTAGSCMEVGFAIPKSECWHPVLLQGPELTHAATDEIMSLSKSLRRCQEMSGDVRSQEVKVPTKSQAVRGTHVPAWLTNHVCPFSGLLISIEFLNFAIFSCYNCFTRLSHWFAEWLCFPSFQLRGLLTFLEPFLRNSTNWGVSVWTHSETGRWNKSLEAWKNVDTTTSHDNSNLERLTFMLWCSCILHLGISMLKLTPAPYSLHNTTTSGSQILQGCSICTCVASCCSISLFHWAFHWDEVIDSCDTWRSKDMGFQLIHHQDLSVTWLTTDRNIPRQSKETKQSKVGDFDFQMKTEFRGRSKQKRFWGTDVETWPPSTEWAVFQPQCTEIEPVETVEILWLLLNL